MSALPITHLERIAVFVLPDGELSKRISYFSASRISFAADPDGYTYSAPTQSLDTPAVWFARHDGSAGAFVNYVTVAEPALAWAIERKLITHELGYTVTWPEGSGFRSKFTSDRAEAELAHISQPYAKLVQRDLPVPSERFAARLEHEFGHTVAVPEIINGAAVGIWLGSFHPDIDGILSSFPGDVENRFGVGSLIMGRFGRFTRIDTPPATPPRDPADVSF